MNSEDKGAWWKEERMRTGTDKDINGYSTNDSGSEDHPNYSSEVPEFVDVDKERQEEMQCEGDMQHLTTEDVLAKEFRSLDDAYNFYCKYAKCIGFVVRRDDVGYSTDGSMIWRQFVCNRQGQRNKKHVMKIDRKRKQRPLTRTGCGAKIRVNVDESSEMWKVTQFDPTHNHDLTPASMVHLMTGYRKITEADKAQIETMCRAGFRTAQIYSFFVDKHGGCAGLGFSKKDLYNYIDKRKRDQVMDGDDAPALGHLQAKADNDPIAFRLRYSALEGACNWLSYLASQSMEDFDEIRNELRRLTTKLEKKHSDICKDANTNKDVVDDPKVVKRKDAPCRQKRKLEKHLNALNVTPKATIEVIVMAKPMLK